MGQLDEAFKSLKSEADLARSEQRLQTTAQRKSFEAFLDDINSAQQSINEVFTSTKGLSSSLDAATEKLDKLSYANMANQVLRCISLMLVVLLVSPYIRKGLALAFTLATGRIPHSVFIIIS